jgi:hypothetical protein
VLAKAPEELKKVPVADLAAEVNEQIEAIGMWTESPASAATACRSATSCRKAISG